MESNQQAVLFSIRLSKNSSMINEEEARWMPGGRALQAEGTAMQVQGDAWPEQRAGWLVPSERKKCTEDMRLAK